MDAQDLFPPSLWGGSFVNLHLQEPTRYRRSPPSIHGVGMFLSMVRKSMIEYVAEDRSMYDTYLSAPRYLLVGRVEYLFELMWP